MQEQLLALKNISVYYGGVKALSDISFFVNFGEKLLLLGPNGAGKSTVLKTIFGLTSIKRGEIFFHGRPIEPKPHEMVAAGVAFVPQGRRVFNHLTIEENLQIGGHLIKNQNELKRRMAEIFEIFPLLKARRREKSGILSGGQQQLLAIARGLMADPKVLLLDEPSLGLAPKMVKEVFAKIIEINERHKTAIVVVEHNIRSLLSLMDRVYVLDKGQVVAVDRPTEIISSNILEKVFLGKA